MAKNIPDKLNLCNIYKKGNRLIGVADEITIPDIEHGTEGISGFGLLGEIDSPGKTNIGSMEQEMAKGEEEPDVYIIRFAKPYHFEGKSYAGVDLSGMQSLRAKDIWKIDRNYQNAGNIGILKEMDNEYTCRAAVAASGMPVEFFMGMALADIVKVRTKVSDFFIRRNKLPQ